VHGAELPDAMKQTQITPGNPSLGLNADGPLDIDQSAWLRGALQHSADVDQCSAYHLGGGNEHILCYR